MPSIVHFEIPADNVQRAMDFYRKLFGWEITKTEGEFEYYFINTKKSEDEPGINGGMMSRQMPQQTPVNYVQVDNVQMYLDKAVELGAKIIVPKTAIPGMGFFAVFMDTENNPLGIWMDDNNAK